ncbi:uncharacterized protein F4807DRAFT_467005 [Annulohypoxylon truncatum]|uniref:uncharacterized protein n=1 Tax=Annulohypoxylon truncatum TaxID=327061 RepID=UPI0020072DA8|nr:uncharacterized protein F4807DRAFT_467005 [Annulohypoxylon truncatum]KAI1210695.1 hypothetical protein F4807DRAFT_467005 [Annulohypoxylon truncatum]
MVLRRKRILYRRSSYVINPINPPQPVIKPKMETQVFVTRQETQDGSFPSQVIKPVAGPSRINSIVQSATTLAPQSFQQASAPSVVSHVKSVDLEYHEELVFPARPEVPNNGLAEVTCPYCLYVLSTLEVGNEARWRKHVLRDPDALVCLFDPCDEPNVLYRHSKDWLLHMRKYAKRWHCPAKVYGIQYFNNRDEYDIHMKESHQKRYTSAQLDLLAERGTRLFGPLFDICPLCGGKDASDDNRIQGNLMDHIIGHLRSLALKSLPPHYDNDDTASYNSRSDESVESRSTVKSLLDGCSTSFLDLAPSTLISPNDKSLRKYEGDAFDWR